MNTGNSGTVQQVVPKQVLLSVPRQQRPEGKQTNPLTRAIVHGKYASPEVVAARIEICRQCDQHRITSGGVDWCEVSNCKVSREDRRIDNLAAYEENLPKWGCMHPSRGQGRGWSLPFPVDSKAAAAIFPQYGSRAAVPAVNSATPKSSADNSSPVLHKQVQLLFNAADKPVDLENIYRGRSCFLICGGPSFEKLNHSKLRQPGILTMAVNNAAKTFRPNLWTCVDNPDHFLRSIWLDPAILKLVPMDVRNVHVFSSDAWAYLDKTVADCPNTFFYKRQLDFDAARFLTADTCCWGSNNHDGRVKSVMFAAIRLLHYLGIRRIFLLGCDFKMATRHAYHFEQQRAPDLAVRINNDYNVLQQRFKQLRPIFEAAGLRIYNCNPKSRLDVFEKINFNRAVAMSLEEWGNINVVTERTTGLYDRPKPEPPEPHPPRNRFWHNTPIIPPIAHFVWLGSPLPKMASDFIERFKKLNPSLKVMLWSRIPADMPSDLQEATKRVPQLCQQADLVRLWVLSKHGGIYLDADTYFLRSMEELRHYENFIIQGTDSRLFNGVMGFTKSSPVLPLLLQKARSLAPSAGPGMVRSLLGPNLFTEFHRQYPDHFNVLPTHYFYMIHPQAAALRFAQANPGEQKQMIDNRQNSIVDGVQPFAIHLWGFPAEAMPVGIGISSHAKVQSTTIDVLLGWVDQPGRADGDWDTRSNCSNRRLLNRGCSTSQRSLGYQTTVYGPTSRRGGVDVLICRLSALFGGGLGENCEHTARFLKSRGIASEVMVLESNSALPVCASLKATRARTCLIMAYFIDGVAIEQMARANPDTQFFVKCHSNPQFLVQSVEWNKMVATMDAAKRCHNVKMAAATMDMVETYQAMGAPSVYLPNVFALDGISTKTAKLNDGKLHVGLFCAVRRLKNMVTQVAALAVAAKKMGRLVVLHRNGQRVEATAMNDLKAIQDICKQADIEIMDHGWMSYHQFLTLAGQMHVGLQVSYTETYNYVAANCIVSGTPVVGSPAIRFLPPAWQVDPDNVPAIADAICASQAWDITEGRQVFKEWNEAAGAALITGLKLTALCHKKNSRIKSKNRSITTQMP